MIHLSIIDDHSLFRTCLKDYLLKIKDFTIDFEEDDPISFLQKFKQEQHVDIAIMDLFMPKMRGDELINIIKQTYPKTKIMVLSMCTDLDVISNLIDIGIHSYIFKGDDIENLVSAIHSVNQNKIYRNKIFTDALYWNKDKSPGDLLRKPVVTFNKREIRLLQLLWAEKSNREIANELFLGTRSIEKMRQEMKEKTGVKSTIGLIKYALNNKIIKADKVDVHPSTNEVYGA